MISFIFSDASKNLLGQWLSVKFYLIMLLMALSMLLKFISSKQELENSSHFIKILCHSIEHRFILDIHKSPIYEKLSKN